MTETRLVHFVIVDGKQSEIEALVFRLKEIKKNLPFNMEFLVTNDRIQIQDIRALITELYILYKKNKKLYEKK